MTGLYVFWAGLGQRTVGAENGFTRRTQRHAERPAWPEHTKRAIRRRHVAYDHGNPWAFGLEGRQASYWRPAERRPARRHPPTGALASRRRHWWRRDRWRARRCT